MKIEVKLFATLAMYLPDEEEGNSATVDVPDGTTVGQLMHRLGIPDEMPRITLINGRDAALEQLIHDGDTLSAFPPLAGGA